MNTLQDAKVLATAALTAEKRELAVQAMGMLMTAMGIDWHQQGMYETPARHVKYLEEFLYDKKEFKVTTFELNSDSMVVVENIEFFSLCEHHLLPFFGKATIAYLPGNRMVGLSKLPRLLDYVVRRPQNQERICQQVIEMIDKTIQPRGAAITISAHHTCMSMRGARCNHSVNTITTHLSGLFKTSDTVRQEYNTYLLMGRK